MSPALLAADPFADAVWSAFLLLADNDDDVARFLCASEEPLRRFLEGFEALTESAQSVACAALAVAVCVFVMSGSPDRSSDNRCSHQEKPRCTSGVGDAAAEWPRFNDSTNACRAREIERKVDLGR
jgi:hypothetical protein